MKSQKFKKNGYIVCELPQIKLPSQNYLDIATFILASDHVIFKARLPILKINCQIKVASVMENILKE